MVQTSISSKTNALVKKLRKLADRKYRTEYGEYIAEGKRWIADAKRLCPQNVLAVISSRSAFDGSADVVLDDSIFNELSFTENNQGIMALMKIPDNTDDFSGNYCLFLDRVRDPGNMGAIIRTACAAGSADIILRDCVDVYNPKVIRSSMTGVLGVKFHYADTLASIAERGYVTVGAVLGGKDSFAAEFNFKKVCLVIGNEADGISETVLRDCVEKVTIPMRDGMESLNAAVSAGILMYNFKYMKNSIR